MTESFQRWTRPKAWGVVAGRPGGWATHHGHGLGQRGPVRGQYGHEFTRHAPRTQTGPDRRRPPWAAPRSTGRSPVSVHAVSAKTALGKVLVARAQVADQFIGRLRLRR
jgi:hypothetical protein